MVDSIRATIPPQEPGFRRLAHDRELRPNGSVPTDISQFPGRLIVIEGPDGVGRSTQIAFLREWLEASGLGVTTSALGRGRLAREGLRKAKQGTTLGQLTMDLYYATDFADRLENEILPALRGGFVVICDRYIYSMVARSTVRGILASWLNDVYQFAPTPHATFYLKVDLRHLTPRVLTRGGFDYWESGMDFQEDMDLYSSFVRYQTKLSQAFDDLARQYHFEVIDANRSVHEIFCELKNGISKITSRMKGINSR